VTEIRCGDGFTLLRLHNDVILNSSRVNDFQDSKVVALGLAVGSVWAQRRFCPNFPKFAQKHLCGKISPYKFSAAVGIIFSSFMLTETRIWNIWFLITQLRKSKLGCARTLSEASWLSTLDYLSHSSKVWRSIHIPAVAVSKELHT